MKLFKKALDIAAIGYIGTAFYYQYNVSHPDTWGYEDVIEYGIENGYFEEEFIRNFKKELVILRSEFGYDLYGYFIDNGSDKNVIFSHGVTSNIYGMMKYAPIYLEMGFNIFVYDHRNHGRSGGNNTTFGYFEKDDLETVVQWMRDRVGHDKVLGVHGESMGTAIALQHNAKYKTTDFVVADCGFATMNGILREITGRDANAFVQSTRPLASLINKAFGADFYMNISPIKAVEQIEVPVFFVHGDADDYVYPSNSRDMFAAKLNGYRKIYYAKGAIHARSIVMDRENYNRELKSFFKDIKVL